MRTDAPLMLSLWDEIEAGILTWAPIVFMALICFVLWRTLKLMPRTKPQQIKPESKGSIGWAGSGSSTDVSVISGRYHSAR